jgi:site-specific DNA recombinase
VRKSEIKRVITQSLYLFDSILPYNFHVRQMQENIAKAIMAADTMSPDGIQARLDELQDFIASQETDITEFDEALVKKLIEKITVFADHFTVEFKSGITIDIEA